MLPLDDILVLDLSRVLAGPYCTMILGDLGAEIIKVESPVGDETRSWDPPFIGDESVYYLAVNRNKQSIIADLNRDDDRDLLLRIAAKADVLVENFRPGTLARFGIDLSDLRTVNPRLITLTVSGMGATGPAADEPGYDFIVQAASGLMSITGPLDGPPSKVGVAVVDLTTGMMAANAILSALYVRTRTGHGQHIDISLLETATSWLANVGTAHLLTGKDAKRHGNAHPTIVPYQTFETKDAVVAVGVGNDGQFARFCSAVDLEYLLNTDAFQTNPQRVKRRDELCGIIAEKLTQLSANEVVRRLKKARVPVSRVNTVAEALADQQIAARNMILKIQHPSVGELSLLGFPYKFSDTPASVRLPPPLHGEHTEHIRELFKNQD